MKLTLPQNKKELQRVLGVLTYYAKWILNFSEKVRPFVRASLFPLISDAILAFKTLKSDLLKARLDSTDEFAPFSVECDASDYAIAAILSQKDRQVAFISKTLFDCETRYPTVEKETPLAIEAVRKQSH